MAVTMPTASGQTPWATSGISPMDGRRNGEILGSRGRPKGTEQIGPRPEKAPPASAGACAERGSQPVRPSRTTPRPRAAPNHAEREARASAQARKEVAYWLQLGPSRLTDPSAASGERGHARPRDRWNRPLAGGATALRSKATKPAQTGDWECQWAFRSTGPKPPAPETARRTPPVSGT